MPKKGTKAFITAPIAAPIIRTGKPSSLLDTRVVSGCETWGDNLEQLAKPPRLYGGLH